MIKLPNLISCEWKILESIVFWLHDIDSKFWLHDYLGLTILYISWFCANHGKGIVRISNLLGLLVDSFLLMFSENPIEEDEQLVRSDSEWEDLEWAKRDYYRL